MYLLSAIKKCKVRHFKIKFKKNIILQDLKTHKIWHTAIINTK